MDFTMIPKLEELIEEIPDDSIVSRTVFEADGVKVILFGFAPGQSLSEHTAARPALLHFLAGEAHLTLGSESFEVGPQAWVHMPPHLPHSVVAKSQTLMLLQLLP